jgi:excisionase family DNA binding protein
MFNVFAESPKPESTLHEDILMDGLMTVREVADFLRVSQDKVQDLIKSGRLPSVKIDRCRRIPRRGLAEFLATRLVGASVDPVAVRP